MRTDATPGAARDQSIDIARGLAIVAIVLGHVNRGLIAAGLGADWSYDLDRVLYLFHLSVFAWLAGLYLRPGLARRGVRGFLVDRSALFLWLYVLWHVLQVTVKLATSALVNSPGTPSDLIRLWIPEGQLWFLPWLLSVTVLVALWRPWSSTGRAASLVVVAGAIAALTWGVDPAAAFTRAGALLLPFALGAVSGAEVHRRLFASRAAPVLAVVGIGGLVLVALMTDATPPTVDTPDRTWSTVSLGFLGCVLGTVGVLALAGWWARIGAHQSVAFVGRRSLEIFLAHIIPASGTRILLEKAGVDQLGVQLVLGTVVGLGAALALWWLAPRVRLGWLFVLPGPVSRRLST